MSMNGRETETKYELPTDAPLPQLDELPQVSGTAGPDEQQLVAEYYDTDDLRLLRAGITLRRRTGGDDAGWHLKLPVGRRHPAGDQAAARASGARRVPARAVRAGPRCAAAAGRWCRSPSVSTRRQAMSLLGRPARCWPRWPTTACRRDRASTTVVGASWREVEVELAGGDSDLLKAVDEVLRRDGLTAAGARRSWSECSASQLPPASGQAADRRRSPARQVVASYLAAQAEELKSLDPMVRRDKPDSVHQMRVATRRLRSTLRTFGAVIRRRRHRALAAELKWLGGVLGEARDAEVLAAHLRRACGR